MQLLELELQSADPDGGSELPGLLEGEASRDLRLSVREGCPHRGSADDLVVIIDSQALSLLVCLCGCFRKLLGSFLCHGQVNANLCVLHGISEGACLSVLHVRSVQLHAPVCENLVNPLQHHIGNPPVRIHGCLIIQVPLRIRLGNKIQRTGLAKLLQNRIGIGNSGDLDINPVIPLLIHNSLRAVALHTLLQLVDGIRHVIPVRLLVSHHLISDADASRKVKSQLDVRCGTGILRTDPHCRRVAKACKQQYKHR